LGPVDGRFGVVAAAREGQVKYGRHLSREGAGRALPSPKAACEAGCSGNARPDGRHGASFAMERGGKKRDLVVEPHAKLAPAIELAIKRIADGS